MIPFFLHCQWRNILFINYRIDPTVLRPLVPRHTRLEFWEEECLITLAAFEFGDIKMMGAPVPGHQHMEEINLRFYITHTDTTGKTRRAVMFISEIVPRAFFRTIANTLFKEKYLLRPTRSQVRTDRHSLQETMAPVSTAIGTLLLHQLILRP